MEVYVASNMPTSYPRKLQKPSTVNSRVRNTAERFIMDSGISDDVGTAEVLDLAHEYDADYVVAKDELHDLPATTQNVARFFELYQEHDCDAQPMIPVQCDPAADRWHVDHLPQLPTHSHYVLGGMAVDEVLASDQIPAIKQFREAVGPDAHVHGLGVGGGMEFVSAVAGQGWLDSVDCSTPEMAGQFGCVINQRLRQEQVRVMAGDGAARRNVPLSDFNSWQLQDVWKREAEQCGLEAYD